MEEYKVFLINPEPQKKLDMFWITRSRKNNHTENIYAYIGIKWLIIGVIMAFSKLQINSIDYTACLLYKNEAIRF